MSAHPLRTIDAHGGSPLLKGSALLTNSLLNKGTAFSYEERDALALRGLLPPKVFPLELQLQRVLGNLRRKTDNLEKYIFLTTLQNRNETLFYKLLVEHLEEVMPLIYTPTVGQACLEYASIFRRPRGLFITIEDKGRIREILHNWTTRAKLIVVTDGERILGLGDLGSLGMGIPVGKLSLYSACAGVHPYYCLPISLDVGTDNPALLADPMYIGLNRKRVRGEEYEAFIEEFVDAVQEVFPGSLLQFEDFGNHNAFHLLHKYQKRICCFNDDIQGTASVALAGLISATRSLGKKLSDQKLLFLGAGEAGTGIADLYVTAAIKEGLSEAEARARCWFVDSKGLLVSGRGDTLPANKKPYAHNHPFVRTFLEAVEIVKPTAIVGVAGTGRAFDEKVLTALAKQVERPIVFALSNPTSKAECTAEEAYRWTEGRCIFASGSPFPAVEWNGKTYQTGQGNNVYIFPGVGLGALVALSSTVTNEMFLAAAETLANEVQADDLAVGRVYPSLKRIREVSARIATAVATMAWDQGLATRPRPDDIEAEVRSRMFEPHYESYI